MLNPWSWYPENSIRKSSFLFSDYDFSLYNKELSNQIKFNNHNSPLFHLQLSRDQKQFPQYGGYYHIKSDLHFFLTDKFRIDTGGGLVRQNIPGATHPLLQYGIQSSLQYQFNSRLSFRVYGQRLWFFEEDENNSFLYRNAMVPQTEVGGGISVTLRKNLTFNLGPRIILDTQTPEKRNMKMINFRIVFRF